MLNNLKCTFIFVIFWIWPSLLSAQDRAIDVSDWYINDYFSSFIINSAGGDTHAVNVDLFSDNRDRIEIIFGGDCVTRYCSLFLLMSNLTYNKVNYVAVEGNIRVSLDTQEFPPIFHIEYEGWYIEEQSKSDLINIYRNPQDESSSNRPKEDLLKVIANLTYQLRTICVGDKKTYTWGKKSTTWKKPSDLKRDVMVRRNDDWPEVTPGECIHDF